MPNTGAISDIRRTTIYLGVRIVSDMTVTAHVSIVADFRGRSRIMRDMPENRALFDVSNASIMTSVWRIAPMPVARSLPSMPVLPARRVVVVDPQAP